MTTMIIETLDDTGRLTAYRADPAGKPRAAIVVIQEIFGINEGIRRKCDTLADAGYLAIAPDLFWRVEPGIELDPDDYISGAQARSRKSGRFPPRRQALPVTIPSISSAF